MSISASMVRKAAWTSRSWIEASGRAQERLIRGQKTDRSGRMRDRRCWFHKENEEKFGRRNRPSGAQLVGRAWIAQRLVCISFIPYRSLS